MRTFCRMLLASSGKPFQNLLNRKSERILAADLVVRGLPVGQTPPPGGVLSVCNRFLCCCDCLGVQELATAAERKNAARQFGPPGRWETRALVPVGDRSGQTHSHAFGESQKRWPTTWAGSGDAKFVVETGAGPDRHPRSAGAAGFLGVSDLSSEFDLKDALPPRRTIGCAPTSRECRSSVLRGQRRVLRSGFPPIDSVIAVLPWSDVSELFRENGRLGDCRRRAGAPVLRLSRHRDARLWDRSQSILCDWCERGRTPCPGGSDTPDPSLHAYQQIVAT